MKLQFGDFVLDSDARQLLQRGAPVHLPRKAFDALCLLAEHRPNPLSKDELHERLWPETHVVDASLSVAIDDIRRALGDDPQAPRFIRTVHRIGYAFCGEALEVGTRADGRPPQAWLTLGDRVLRLENGENVVGRDPASAVWLDEAGVSRRHAALTLETDGATLRDLGSKNGTWLNGEPVHDPQRVFDGDRIQVGPITFDFRTSSRATDTETVRLDLGRRGGG